MVDGARKGFDFQKFYLIRKDCASAESAPGGRAPENDPRAYFAALRRLCQERPDIVIASLWRSCLLLTGLKLLRPGTTCVTFLHSAVDVHLPDRVLNVLAMLLSREIWADSRTTLDARVPRFLRKRGRVISFLLHHAPDVQVHGQARPEFVFWGRLHWQKDLHRAVRLFAKVRSLRPNARFHVIGPDGGQRASLEQLLRELELQGSVLLYGAMQQQVIFQLASTCSFYLQTSIDEGMAMSVVEAMQLALVPVVTPVGEIASYCRDGENAIVIGDEDAAVRRILDLLEDHDAYHRLAQEASRTWRGRSLYADDVSAACLALVKETRHRT